MEITRACLCKICFIRKVDLIGNLGSRGLKEKMHLPSCENFDCNFRHTGISLDLNKVTYMLEVKHVYLQNVVLVLRNRCFQCNKEQCME